MKQKLKKVFLIICCIPLVLICSCSSKTGKIDVGYYFAESVSSTFFNSSSARSLTVSDLTRKKVNKNLLDSYCSITLEEASVVSRTYHLYIDYIVFYVYANESSEYDFNITTTIKNVVDEEKVGTETTETFSETYSGKPVAKKSIKFVINVNKVVANATGCSIMFDITNSEIYNTNETVTFRWAMFGLEIHAEPRMYNS